MSGFFSNEYWKEDFTEIEILDKMEARGVVEIKNQMDVIDSTWEFKIN